MSEQCPLDTDGDGNCPKHPLGCVCSGCGSPPNPLGGFSYICGRDFVQYAKTDSPCCNLIRELRSELADARKRADQPNIVGAAPRSRPLSPGQKLLVDDAVSTIKEALDDGCLVPEQPPNDEPAAGTSIKINLPQAAIPALEDLLRQERDAERDRAADWLERRATQVDGVRGYLCVENTDAADSLRANEHRTPQTNPAEHRSEPNV